MLAALFAVLGRPAWWSMALAAFLVRGGILLALLPIVALPTPAGLANMFSPTIQDFALGGLTLERLALVGGLAVALFAIIGGGGLVGAWLDHAQLREAAEDDELELGWEPAHPSVREALALRLTAHLPTILAAGYAAVRLVAETYDELISPGDVAAPLFLRVAARAPDAIAIVVATWLAGETVGSLAARRAAAGGSVRESLWRSARQLASRRGLATLALTSAVVLGVLAPFLLAAGRAWGHLREVILGDAGFLQVGAALMVLVATWILGLAILGVALAWRSAAWTAEVAPRRAPAPEAAPAAAAEATLG